jgi:Cu(I)/Ag(I) efflux system protein CusF
MLYLKFTGGLIAAASVIGSLACGGGAGTANTTSSPSSPVSASTPVIPLNGNYPAKGRITKINMELGSAELDHGEIPGLMPPMIMEFFVKDKALLDGVKVGDTVDFVIEYKHPSETIVSIKKVQ